MARTTELTYEIVAKAASELQQLGIVPTQALVVKKVGGSNSTVGPHLRAWKKERDKNAAAGASDTPRHIEVDLAVTAVVRRAEAAAREESQGELDEQLAEIEQLTAERDQGRDQVATLGAEVSSLARERDQLQGQFSQLQRDFSVALDERSQINSELKDARQTIGQANERIQGLEARLSEIVRSEAQLRAEMEQLRVRATAAEDRQAQAEHARATSVAELEARMKVEQRSRTDAESRVTGLLDKLDATAPKLERLAAAEASERALRDQVAMLIEQLAASDGREREARAVLAKRGSSQVESPPLTGGQQAGG